MSRWEDFKKTEKTKPPSEKVGGNFACQHYGCWEYADTAEYFFTDYVLKWTCPQGHISFAEDFKL